MLTEVIVAGIALMGVLFTQHYTHRRWVHAQRDEREVARVANVEERRKEHEELLSRIEEQNNSVFSNALHLVEENRRDATTARELAVRAEGHHAECRQQVAVLDGRVKELQVRIMESERSFGQIQSELHRVSDGHQTMKHAALNALTVSESYMAMVKKLVKGCTCSAFLPITELTEHIHPQADSLIEKNRRLALTPGVAPLPPQVEDSP